jgi:hypothetical protein
MKRIAQLNSLDEAFRFAMNIDMRVQLPEGNAVIRDVRRSRGTNGYEVECELLRPQTDHKAAIIIGFAILALLSV